ncbi:hypothetical protein ACIBJF_53530, partial [Streptomyces sp. NPDC050743]|uniref:hypothetical protein n=1 Tax=Streptomyces sp. NPDC050743 TaxID=3365634 RepID=UPI0037BC0E76
HGVTGRTFGNPMISWPENMPSGMILKPTPVASNLAPPGLATRMTAFQDTYEERFPHSIRILTVPGDCATSKSGTEHFGDKSPMQTTGIKPPAPDTRRFWQPWGRDLLLAGAAVAAGGAGAVLAFTDVNSPLRGPFTLFFLLATPTAAIGAALHDLEPASRLVVALAGAFAVNLLVAQAMLAAHRWSPRGGVAAVAALSLLIFLLLGILRLAGQRKGQSVHQRVISVARLIAHQQPQDEA